MQVDKNLARLAICIHEQAVDRLAARQQFAPRTELPAHDWRRAQRLVKQIAIASSRGWHAAARRLRSQLAFCLELIAANLSATQRGLRSSTGPPVTLVTPRDLYRDMVGLKQEFGDLGFSLKDKTLTVTTEEIELEGVYLGPFEIELRWDRLDDDYSAYRISAQDPHPAASNDEVTHPHVQGGVLCEGDARMAIRAAFSDGRLFDFFVLVTTVLRTYNPSSPYVKLSVWEGEPCCDCGGLTDCEEMALCERCGESICDECRVYCVDCDNRCCCSCVRTCSECDQDSCVDCQRFCPQCEKTRCGSCHGTEDLCEHCIQTNREEDDDDHRCEGSEKPQTTAAAA